MWILQIKAIKDKHFIILTYAQLRAVHASISNKYSAKWARKMKILTRSRGRVYVLVKKWVHPRGIFVPVFASLPDNDWTRLFPNYHRGCRYTTVASNHLCVSFVAHLRQYSLVLSRKICAWKLKNKRKKIAFQWFFPTTHWLQDCTFFIYFLVGNFRELMVWRSFEIEDNLRRSSMTFKCFAHYKLPNQMKKQFQIFTKNTFVMLDGLSQQSMTSDPLMCYFIHFFIHWNQDPKAFLVFLLQRKL